MPNTIGATRTNPPQTVQQPGFNTAPSRTAPFQMHNAQNSTAHSETYHGDNSGMRRSYDEFGTNAGQNSSVNEIDSFRRPSLSQHTGRRLTLVNSEEPESPPSAGPPPQQQSPPKKFLSAFEEKKLLQESYGREAGGSGSGPTQASSIPAQSTARTTSPQSQRTAWPSAEEEKQKLYNMARQRAEQTQATMGISMPSMVCVMFIVYHTFRLSNNPLAWRNGNSRFSAICVSTSVYANSRTCTYTISNKEHDTKEKCCMAFRRRREDASVQRCPECCQKSPGTSRVQWCIFV